MPQDPAQFDDLPEPLARDLREMYRADVTPAPVADQAILNRARAHVAGRKRTLLLRRVAGAAAAVILLAATLIPFHRTDQGMGRARARARGDLNVDGTVDIRDALALQRSLDAGQATGVDITGDGVTDKRDVDAIAMLAVRLDRGATR